jgi:hypothetical protein
MLRPFATIEEFLVIRKKIEALNASLASILGGTEDGNGNVAKRRGRPAKASSVESPAPAAPVVKDGRKGKRSAATIAKMKAAQQARWAKNSAAAPAPAAPVVEKAQKKRTMSPEGRARIAAAQKARWAKSRKA